MIWILTPEEIYTLGLPTLNSMDKRTPTRILTRSTLHSSELETYHQMQFRDIARVTLFLGR